MSIADEAFAAIREHQERYVGDGPNGLRMHSRTIEDLAAECGVPVVDPDATYIDGAIQGNPVPMFAGLPLIADDTLLMGEVRPELTWGQKASAIDSSGSPLYRMTPNGWVPWTEADVLAMIAGTLDQ